MITQVYLMDLEITGIPYELCPRLAYYLVRLVYDIVRCGVEVAIALLKGRPEICRVVVELPTEDHLLNAIVCNTITLTPGTISLEMQGRHAEILRLNTTGATLEKIRADIEAGYAVLKPSAAEK
ncbi:hypothetical protein SDC9_137409 [bioreactor metagenome]|uniref:Uncharacterized protein n=1 Tax=bioreactor metagenome TaxID=1076179 RepID=A0A645DMH2_9ZZZZ